MLLLLRQLCSVYSWHGRFQPDNPVMLQSFLPVPYFASERSFAQFRLPEDTKAVVGFGPSNSSLIVASTNGSFFTASFDSDKGGICKQESFCKFVELDS